MSRIALVSTLAALLPITALAQVVDDTPRTALMSAFPPEWQALQVGLENAQSQTLKGITFVTGEMEGEPVVLFLSGVSMVNAAMSAQIALDRFTIERIVFSGIAGGVDPSLNIGDVVVPAQWGKYLEGVMGRETDGTFAMPPWMSSPFPNFGMIFTRDFGVSTDRSDEVEERFWFPVDPDLLAIAETVAGDVTLPDCSADGACLSQAPQIVTGGNGVSGAFFVDNAALREHAFSTFDAQVLDMESAAVAHVAYVNEVPFIAFRSLSDLAGGGEGANEMGTFMSIAASNSAQVMRAFVAALN
ncbi:5'-methylthioadenosine/S-adenosylhomocysteine nucleosidase [Oceaniglobus indicus]|uniref:5'-methylthioadenosine/S-adenosylhomocysteine nucleosidase n=1 Tax=Oceaniglobus indicus TaxID=2047749 RepID=UPI000C19498D|nr:5'-methylthioadenosine/S-adenosylhomocysteine nucleosidase [Oceaniglobus indicus]